MACNITKDIAKMLTGMVADRICVNLGEDGGGIGIE